jgi:carbamoyltransferase
MPEPRPPQHLTVEEFFCAAFARGLGQTLRPEQLHFVRHHVAHEVSAFACSGFDRALVLSLDGVGEMESGRIAVAEGTTLETVQVVRQDISLGHLYDYAIRFIGFKMFEEYKAMGLAPYGDPARFRQDFKQFYALLPNGEWATNPRRLFTLMERFPPRKKGEPFEQVHMDLAAALQEALEEIVFHALRHHRQATGLTRLCFAGGVAHNVTMNGKIAASGLFDEVFVQPASHDAGCALGAALALHYQHHDRPKHAAAGADRAAPTSGPARLVDAGARALDALGKVARKPGAPAAAPPPPPAVFPLGRKVPRVEHVFWGTAVGPGAEVEATLARWADLVEVERDEAIEKRAAGLLAGGSVIGWVQGRSEFGPRALGNRSILADARPAENKRLINAMVKKREGFRPFAPSVLEEDARDYFALGPLAASPFMLFVVDVREDKRDLLGAITHVNGSARVQTVSKRTNARYWNLIHEFQALTGVPVLLNTSFNNDAEPIVDSVDDAVVSFLTTNLHYLVVGDHLVRKKEVTPASHDALVPALPRHVRLLETRRFEGQGFVIERAIVSNADEDVRRPLSAVAHAALVQADGALPLGALAERAGAGAGEAHDALVREMIELWSARMITLLPQGA